MFELKTKRPHNASHIENAIQGWSYNDITTCFQALGVSEQGLSTPEVLQRQKSYGYNRINYIASPSWFTQLLKSFLSPFNGILSIVILITLLTQFWVTTASMKDSETIFATNDLSNRVVYRGSTFPNTHHSSDSHPPYSFFQSMAGPHVLWSTVIIMAVGVYLPYSPLAPVLSMQPMPMVYFVWLLGIPLGYRFFTFWIKIWYLKKFKDWL